MLNIISILIGLVAGLIALVGIIPVISLVNWIAFPIALVGAVIGMLSSSNTGRNLNFLVLAISGLRLFLTGGLF
jgi:hypothetical protein|nr:hypothetical protein [uncultured Sphingomonas sp.]